MDKNNWWDSKALCKKHGEFKDFGGTVICPTCRAEAEGPTGAQEAGHDGVRDSDKLFPGRFF